MDGPLFPDYQSRDVLLDLKPFIDRDGYDLTQLADQAVADFTTPDGQFGLPRDLNVVALYYNKKMFDAAGMPYPDETWDWAKLVDVAQEADPQGRQTARSTQWGFYTETTDMENYWSELVWQNGGEIISADHKTSLVGSDQATGGIQFLQDLIWKDKVMPTRRSPTHWATRSSRARRRWSQTARGSSRPTWPPASTSGSRRCRRVRPAGDLDQPDRRRRLQGHEEPGRGLGVREVPGQPGGPDKAHGAQGLDAGEQGGPDRAVRDLVRRAPTSSPTRSTTPTSSRHSRATTTGRPRSRPSSTRTSSTRQQDGPAGDRPRPAGKLDAILAEPVTEAGRADGRDDRASPPDPRRGGGPLVGEGRWALLFLAPTLLGLAVLSAGPILATLAISLTKWDLLTAPKLIGLDNYAALLSDDRFLKALRNTFFYTIVSVPIGLALALGMALGAQPEDPRHRLHPDRLLPAGGDLDDRHRPRLAVDLQPGLGPAQPGLGVIGIPAQKWLNDPTLAMPAIVAMSIWQGLGVNVIIFLAGLQAIPAELLDAASVDGAGRWARFRGVILPLLTPPIFFTGVLSLIDSFQVFDQIFVLVQAPSDGRHHHRRLLHLRERLQVLQDGLRERRLVGPVPHRRVVHGDLFPAAGPLGPLPVTRRRRPRRPAAAGDSMPLAGGGGAGPAGGRSLIGLLIAGGHPDDGPVPVDDLDVAQDPGGGLRGAPTLLPSVPQWQNYPDMWNALPFGTFFFNSLKLADPQHGRPARSAARWPRSPSRHCASGSASRCSPCCSSP